MPRVAYMPMTPTRLVAIAVVSLNHAACVPRDQVGFDAIGPAHRLDAIVLAADAADETSLRGLIQQLDSDDAAARLLAIRALEKRTGQTLGYRHDDPPWLRAEAVDRWVAWADTSVEPEKEPTSASEGD